MEEYLLGDGVFWLRVRPGSPYVGRPRTALDLREFPALTLVGVQAAGEGGSEDGAVRAGDLFIVRGDGEAVGHLPPSAAWGSGRSPRPRRSRGRWSPGSSGWPRWWSHRGRS